MFKESLLKTDKFRKNTKKSDAFYSDYYKRTRSRQTNSIKTKCLNF